MATQYLREKYLLTHDLTFVKELQGVLKTNKMIVAGGAITSIFSGVGIRDYDLYFTDNSKREEVEKWFDEHMTKQAETNNALSYYWFNPDKKNEREQGSPDNLNFQLITIPSTEGGTKNIFERFDYTICMGAYRFEDETFVLHDDFLQHLAQRKLVFNPKTLYPINSLIRSKKYMNRGFNMSNVETLKIALTIHALDLSTKSNLKEQLEGIDTLFLKELSDYLANNGESEYNFGEALQLLENTFENFYSDDVEGLGE
jgi:uncharacterized protein YggL (DUF469 family)